MLVSATGTHAEEDRAAQKVGDMLLALWRKAGCAAVMLLASLCKAACWWQNKYKQRRQVLTKLAIHPIGVVVLDSKTYYHEYRITPSSGPGQA